ncbi:uncharacterized protein LOC142640761 [Castanea sativa]|uniref:uncharacterized protein LOC142640761 n=1 Tax=Castanea sativa TaxID=21020 RepID=UPI003F64FAE7
MNIIIWNSRGTLKPNFQSHVHDLVNIHNPGIMVIMETKVGGDKAREIIGRLPFDEAICIETRGLSGGLWLMWNSNIVEVSLLAKTEQEIHVLIKVRPSDLNFNEPLLNEDKFGGRAVSINKSLLFKECLDKCNMVDLGFARPRFTWTNKRGISDLIQERIDRVFVNPEWWNLFPEPRVTHLTRFWLSDVTFSGVVSGAWSHTNELSEAIRRFTRDAKDWNKSHFGNVFAKKKRIMAWLNGIQRAMAITPSASLVDLEKNLLLELDNVLSQEGELWALKSQINWSIHGDRNTSFFHMFTLVRRMRNKITTIKNSVGDWINEEQQVMEFVQRGFSEIYSSSQEVSLRVHSSSCHWQAKFSDTVQDIMDHEVTTEEIKAGLWSVKAYKAPGPDGLHAGFYQHFWLIVGESVIKEVKKNFAERKMPEYLNKTHIALIPKIQGPETLSNFRPISLCNTVYKIVTKIIVARLRPFLSSVISPLQTAFVPGRRGTDNAIIAQEIIHTISRSKGKEGYMAIKIDLEKAYDNLVDLIMSCVLSVSTSILFNGGCLPPLYPSRGIRQGQLIEEKCSENLWKPVRSSKSGLAFSHLIFADDLVLFAKADQINCSTIRGVLDVFCSKSGQTVSEVKSRVYFSPNVDSDLRETLSDILGFQSTSNIVKYLGIHIKHPGSSNQDFNFVLDRVKQKLSGWKANLLSMAGRTVLIQSASSTIPSYTMQCAYLPGWEKVTRLKKEGGLGLQSAKGRNTALVAKLNWRFHTESSAPWATVLRMKYCSPQRLRSRNGDKLPCSRVWAAMKKGKDTFQKGTIWNIGRDSNLNLWFDKWTSSGPLRKLIEGPFSLEESNRKVKEVISAEGWNWSSISFPLPQDIAGGIQATPYAIVARSQDTLAWAGSHNGNFDLKSAYRIASGNENTHAFKGQWIWKLNILPRIQFFLWKCYHKSLGVKACLAARGICLDVICPLCLQQPETIMHALRDCQLPWKFVFLFAIWSIWLKRNLLVFQNKSAHHSLIPEILSKSSEFFHCTLSPRNAPRMTTKFIKWEKPASGWVKLNTDGSALGNLGIAGCGGLVRDKDGNWVVGFARKIGNSSSFIAEIWALRDGLNVCLQKNLLLVEVELDAKAVVDFLARLDNLSEAKSPLIDDCRHLIAQFHQICINHCYREANRCADTLARMGTNQAHEF